MKKRERDQVTELLRCAADELICGRFADGGFELFSPRIQDLAMSAWVHEVILDEHDEPDSHEQAAMRMLSAAVRVEEASWP